MNKEWPARFSSETDSKSSPDAESGTRERRLKRLPVPLAGMAESGPQPGKPRKTEGVSGALAQLIAGREMPAPPTAEASEAAPPEGKKKRKRNKKKPAAPPLVVAEEPGEGAALAAEPEQPEAAGRLAEAGGDKSQKSKKDETGEDDEAGQSDGYQPFEIDLSKPDNAEYGGEVMIYLRDEAGSDGAQAKQQEPAAEKGHEPFEIPGPAQPDLRLEPYDAAAWEIPQAGAPPHADVPQFRRQPEQQQMQGELSSAGAPKPEATGFIPLMQPSESGGGDSGGALPPGGEALLGSGDDGGGPRRASHQQEWDPARIYREYAERDAEARSSSFAGGVSPAEQVVTRREHNHALYRAEKTGQNRGVAAGLVAGWWLGRRFLRRKLTREFAGQTKEQNKKIQRTETALRYAQEDQTRQQAEVTRQRTELTRLDRYRTAAAPTRPERARTVVPAAETPPAPAAQSNRVALEPQPEGQVAVPPEHVVQASAWHHIEVDARTGRPVELPSFQYGQEYYRERAQETIPLVQRNAAAGGAALTAAATAGSPNGANGGSDNAAPADGAADSSGRPAAPGLPAAYVRSATTQGPPDSWAGRSNAGPIWPYLLALAVIVVCLAWLLH